MLKSGVSCVATDTEYLPSPGVYPVMISGAFSVPGITFPFLSSSAREGREGAAMIDAASEEPSTAARRDMPVLLSSAVIFPSRVECSEVNWIDRWDDDDSDD